MSHALACPAQISNFKFMWIVEIWLYINCKRHLVAWHGFDFGHTIFHNLGFKRDEVYCEGLTI
jgi:hypothetical protein